jgi:hypothetical protein
MSYRGAPYSSRGIGSNLISQILDVKKLPALLVAALLSGCAGLQLCERDVAFEDPTERLGIQEVRPNEAEKAGVVLRFNPAPEGVRKAREDSVLYARIQSDRGLELRLAQDQTEKFRPGSRKDSYFDYRETVFEGEAGKLIDEQEVTTRGEIVKFIRGVHESKLGSIRIVAWKRTPALPEGPVKIGDAWDYDETMDARLNSWWATETDPQPYKMTASCSLAGFALVKGKRAAVVKIHATQQKRETLKVLFKRIAMDVNIDIEETDYLDYAEGVVLAKITRTRSVSSAPDYGYEDEERGQSVFSVQ